MSVVLAMKMLISIYHSRDTYLSITSEDLLYSLLAHSTGLGVGRVRRANVELGSNS